MKSMHQGQPYGRPVRRNNALCCECGTPRSYGAKGHPRQDDPNYRGDGLELGPARDGEVYWRMLRTLKCRTCKAPRRHALIRDDEHRDPAEGRDRTRGLDRREVRARLHRLELAGVAVRWDAADDWPARAIIELH